MVKTRTIKRPCKGNVGIFVLFLSDGEGIIAILLQDEYFAFKKITKKVT